MLILAGRGRYEDPWHDHAATSHAVAVELRALGVDVRLRSTFADAFADLGGFDLIVVNCGRGRPDPAFDGTDEQWRANHIALQRYAHSGGAILGLHQAANTFHDSTTWGAILGGRWIPGRSMHPPRSRATFTPAADHPVTDGLGPVVADDEQYCDLLVDQASEVLVTARPAGVDHPVVWVSGGGHAIYDGLGHGVESYESASRCRLLRREAMWLLGAAADEVRSV